MANFFDQFDAPPTAPAASVPQPGKGNFFDQFDPGGVPSVTKSPSRAANASGATAQTFTVGPNGELIPQGGPQPAQAGVPTALPGVQMGMADPVVGAAQLGAHLLSPVAPSLAPEMDAYVQKREADYQANHPEASPVGRFVGNFAATAPLGFAVPGGAASSLLARVAAGAASGGATAALQPTQVPEGGSFASEKAKDTALGAVLGGAIPAALGGVARIVQPNTSEDVSLLMNKGITPTPGMLLGKSANRTEEGLTSIPLLGDAIRNARFRTVQQLNRAAINDALSPIGESLGKDTPLGREAIDEAATKISGAYNDLLPKLRPQADPTFLDNMGTLTRMAQSMPPARADQLTGILKNTIFDRMSPGGGMTGEGFKEADTKLGQMVRSYRNAPDPDIRQLGDALLQAQTELRNMVARSNPDLAPQLAANNKAYANLLRVQTAAGRQGAEEGVFTPAQLSSAVRQLDPSLRKGGFARGNAVMQDLSDAAKSVLGNKVPDSGTPFRGALLAGPALYGLYATSPEAALGSTIGGLGLLGAYSRPGQAALAHLLASRPAVAAPVASGIRMMSPFAATAGGLLTSGGP